MAVKALGFDLDDTLYSHFDYYYKIFHIMENAIIKTNISFEKFYDIFQYFSVDEYNKFMQEIKSKEEYKNDRVIRAYAHFGHSVSEADAIIFNSLYLYFQNKIELRNGVVDLFNYANTKGIELFILTNGPSEDQRRKIKYLGIEKYIKKENWFISNEIGVSKPNKKIFQKVEDNLQYSNNEIVFVGDSFENDARGASQAGWTGIWLSSTGKHKEEMNSVRTISQVENYL